MACSSSNSWKVLKTFLLKVVGTESWTPCKNSLGSHVCDRATPIVGIMPWTKVGTLLTTELVGVAKSYEISLPEESIAVWEQA